jgi:hypothetical protein
MTSFCQELIKLALQLLCGLFVAWVTVWLALRRFKSERRWERQTSTLAELLVAIDQLDRLNDLWLDAETERREISEERNREMAADNAKAMRDFEKSAAIAAVLLPPDIFTVVQQLRNDLRSEVDSVFDRFDVDGAALQKARAMLIDAGRKLQEK